MTLKKNKTINFFVAFTILYLVFFYDLFVDFFGFFDETVALFFTFVILFSKKIKFLKKEIIILFLLFLIAFIGLLSNYLTTLEGDKTDVIAITGDFITFFKAYIVYFGIRILAPKFNSKVVLKNIASFSELYFYFLLLLIIIDTIFNVFPKSSRYGIHSYELFFGHASRFSFAFSFIFLILLSKYQYSKKHYLLFILLIGLTSLRVKYFGFVLIAVMLMYYKNFIFRLPKKAIFTVLGIFFIALFFVFKDQVMMYFSTSNGWSRGVILNTSFLIGNDYFPFGTGFGTYSCFFSGNYYSWVYGKYGIDQVWGISQFFWGFVSDQFWPMVLGQFGYIGLFAYGIIIYQFITLFLQLLKKTKTQKYNMLVALLGILLLLIDSSSDAIFTQNRAVVIFMLIALLINSYYNIEKSVKK